MVASLIVPDLPSSLYGSSYNSLFFTLFSFLFLLHLFLGIPFCRMPINRMSKQRSWNQVVKELIHALYTEHRNWTIRLTSVISRVSSSVISLGFSVIKDYQDYFDPCSSCFTILLLSLHNLSSSVQEWFFMCVTPA